MILFGLSATLELTVDTGAANDLDVPETSHDIVVDRELELDGILCSFLQTRFAKVSLGAGSLSP